MAKILVVDDRPELLELFAMILKRKGFQVELAGSKENLELQLSTFTPDVILLDVLLNGDNGRTICKEIKHKSKVHIPTILVSADPNSLLGYEDCGACDILEKPFDIKTMVDKINNVLTKTTFGGL